MLKPCCTLLCFALLQILFKVTCQDREAGAISCKTIGLNYVETGPESQALQTVINPNPAQVPAISAGQSFVFLSVSHLTTDYHFQRPNQ